MFGSFSLFSSLCYVVRFNASFRFILTKSAFSLIGLSLGFFYCFRTKKTVSACLQLIRWYWLILLKTVLSFYSFVAQPSLAENNAVLDMNYASSSFIAPQLVFACFQLDNRFFRFSTKGAAGFGETVIQVFCDSSIIWSDTIEVCKLLHRVEWVQLMVIWVGCTLRVESSIKDLFELVVWSNDRAAFAKWSTAVWRTSAVYARGARSSAKSSSGINLSIVLIVVRGRQRLW